MQSNPSLRAPIVRFVVLIALLLASFAAPAGNTVYAATLGVCPTCQFTTIQAAINAAAPNDIIQVSAGVYNENLIINKAITLKGAGAGILAKGRAGGASVIKALATGKPIDLQASQVVIDGFVLDGSASTSGWIIESNPTTGYDNVSVLNNEFIGNPAQLVSGVWQASNPGGVRINAHQGLTVQGNYFNQLGNSAVYLIGQSRTTIYRNNDSYQCFSSNLSLANGPHYNAVVENNRAIGDSTLLWGTREGIVRGNSFQGTATWGSRLYLGGGNMGIDVEGNTFVDPREQAIYAWNDNSDVLIANNTITVDVADLFVETTGLPNPPIEYGMIDLSDAEGVNTVRGNRITFSGTFPESVKNVYGILLRGKNLGSVNILDNELDGGSVGGTTIAGQPETSGVFLFANDPDLFLKAMPVTGDILLQGNKITGFVYGVSVYDGVNKVYGGLPVGKKVGLHINDLTGNSSKGVITGDAVQIDATSNWWGDKYGVPAEITQGAVLTDPWLCSGVDSLPAVGFQPVGGSCTLNATRLVVSQVSKTEPRQPFQPALVVRAEDDHGNRAVSINQDVTVAIHTGPAGAQLLGTKTLPLVDGTATFNDLTLDKTGSYRLIFTTTGLPDALTNTFAVGYDVYLPLAFVRRP